MGPSAPEHDPKPTSAALHMTSPGPTGLAEIGHKVRLAVFGTGTINGTFERTENHYEKRFEHSSYSASDHVPFE